MLKKAFAVRLRDGPVKIIIHFISNVLSGRISNKHHPFLKNAIECCQSRFQLLSSNMFLSLCNPSKASLLSTSNAESKKICEQKDLMNEKERNVLY